MGSWQRYKPAVSARPIGNSSPFDWSAVEDSITYPEFAHRARLDGTVPIEIVIDPEGAASTAFFAPYDEGEAEPNELLVKAATRGLQRALFSPAPGDTLRARVLVRFSLVPRADLSTVSR